ncbi:MAG: hypothetical protein WCX65_15985 [bacterium]
MSVDCVIAMKPKADAAIPISIIIYVSERPSLAMTLLRIIHI